MKKKKEAMADVSALVVKIPDVTWTLLGLIHVNTQLIVPVLVDSTYSYIK